MLKGLKEEAPFIPDEMFELLVCKFEDLTQLLRVLQLEWVRLWWGWDEIRSRLAACDDADVKKLYVRMRLKNFRTDA